jgi:hypothetical protein
MCAAHVTDQMVGADHFLSTQSAAYTCDLIIPGGDQDDVAVGCQCCVIREYPAFGGIGGPPAFFGMAIEVAADRDAAAMKVTPKSGGDFSGTYESDTHGSISGPEDAKRDDPNIEKSGELPMDHFYAALGCKRQDPALQGLALECMNDASGRI